MFKKHSFLGSRKFLVLALAPLLLVGWCTFSAFVDAVSKALAALLAKLSYSCPANLMTKGFGAFPTVSIQTLFVCRYSRIASIPLSRPSPDLL